MTFRKPVLEDNWINNNPDTLEYYRDYDGCDDAVSRKDSMGWTPCLMPNMPADRRKCNFLGTDKCPHNQGKEE